MAPEAGRMNHRQPAEPDSNSPTEDIPAQNNVTLAAPSGMEIDELEKSMSALRFVPPSVIKGQGRSGKSHDT